MAYLQVRNATKTFAGGMTALRGVSLDVRRGEFFTLLGPSGCGKTTLLRAIAGFNPLTSGTIAVDGTDLTSVPPHKRDIGMVFQDYAVFPHLSVFDNVAFGLKPRKVPAAEVARRVPEALEAVRLAALADRLPAAMSGGQQQRIGLARAMVINPRLLLMDEPLSNLDAKLRIELREEIRDIQQKVGIATIYVTHDQEEALAISDRICVMSNGHVEQVGSPEAIYGDPQTLFVARFVGTLNELERGQALTDLLRRLELDRADGPGINWAIRPEDMRLVPPGGAREAGAATLEGTVSKCTYLGREAHLHLRTDAGDLIVHVVNPSRVAIPAAGTNVAVALLRGALMGFDAEGRRVAASGAA
ncbi:ABC transporter ATP-binding protein [Aureimonas sp. AU4]|uniref:ABC transporter ATP-binding protein n=1 Tax=Aureimonas sp. AU4 TaxID=1638163 RepID=UPI000782E8DB|nr:ABC transporter ATP-binding protein [Aureimonas sp. AU4]